MMEAQKTMREILFRGKRMDNGEWVYGDYITIYDTDTPRYKAISACEINTTRGIYKVDLSTVGQYTGLTDSESNTVFEGDIIKFSVQKDEIEWVGMVEFGNPNYEYSWGFQLVYVSGDEPNKDILLWFDMEECGVFSEVIGNRWDNPELLEEEPENG